MANEDVRQSASGQQSSQLQRMWILSVSFRNFSENGRHK